MFTVIYNFRVKSDKKAEFEQSWNEITTLIYKYCNSLGSRLHKQKDNNDYIAYAQWPDEYTFRNSKGKLPESADSTRSIMRDSCNEIETLFELDVIDDLVQSKTK